MNESNLNKRKLQYMRTYTPEEAHKTALRLLDIEAEHMTLEYCKDGHEGEGWYAWDNDYPDEGSVFVGA